MLNNLLLKYYIWKSNKLMIYSSLNSNVLILILNKSESTFFLRFSKHKTFLNNYIEFTKTFIKLIFTYMRIEPVTHIPADFLGHLFSLLIFVNIFASIKAKPVLVEFQGLHRHDGRQLFHELLFRLRDIYLPGIHVV